MPKLHLWNNNLQILLSKLKTYPTQTYDLINADDITIYETDTDSLYGSYNIFRPSSQNYFIIDCGNLHSEMFRKGLIAYFYNEDIILNKIYNCNSTPIQDRPDIIVYCKDNEWVTPLIKELITKIDL